MNVDIDIDAGEETASTDGIVEMEPIEYAESESSITFEEDLMDVDVAVKDIDDFREDSIEAILPKSPIRAVSFFKKNVAFLKRGLLPMMFGKSDVLF
jgi:hypothetical protein